MMDHTRVKLIVACAIFSAVSSSINTAVAQGDDEFFDDSPVLEEIIIDARQRQKNRQNTPAAISTLSAAKLQEAGISKTADLQQAIPGLVFQQTGSKNPTIFLRGVGQREATAIFDPGVGVYINGVYMPRADAHLLDTIDTEEIEVLRGPQGTAFGKNTTGGAILINTRRPNSEQFEGFGTVRTGNLGRRDAKLSVNIPISKDLAMRAAVNSVKRDGYMLNLYDGDRYGDEARVAATSRINWDMSDSLNADLFLYTSRQNENGAPYTCFWVNNDDAFLGNVLFVDPSVTRSGNPNYIDVANDILAGRPLAYENHCKQSEALAEKNRVLLNGSNTFEMTSNIVSGTLSLKINDNLSAKGIVAWSRQQDIVIQDDLDAVDLDIYRNGTLTWNDALSRIGIDPGEEQRDQVSGELQLFGTAMQETLAFTLGVFYAKETLLNNPFSQSIGTNNFAAALIPHSKDNGVTTETYLTAVNTFLGKQNDLDNESFGAYFQANYDFNEWLSFSAGLRYSVELRQREVSIYRFKPFNVRLINQVLADNLAGELESAYGGNLSNELAILPLGSNPDPSGTDPNATNSYGYTTSEWPIIFTLVDTNGDPVSLEDGGFDPTDIAAVTNLFSEYAQNISYYGGGTPALQGPDKYTDNEEFTDISPMLTVSLKAPPRMLENTLFNNALIYGTYSEGFKAGGLEPRSSRGDRLSVFDPEEVINLEFGFKFDMFKNKLQVNGTFYHLIYDNIQVRIAEEVQNQSGAIDLYVGNAEEAFINGAELEVFATPLTGLVLSLTGNFMKAEYDTFTTPRLDGNGNVITIDRSDEDFYGIPELSYTLTATYNLITEYGLFVPRISAYYKDQVFIGVDSEAANYDQAYLDAYTLWSARLTWVPTTMDSVATTIFVENLFDEDHYIGGFAVPSTAGTVTAVKGPPRAFGLEVSYKF